MTCSYVIDSTYLVQPIPIAKPIKPAAPERSTSISSITSTSSTSSSLARALMQVAASPTSQSAASPCTTSAETSSTTTLSDLMEAPAGVEEPYVHRHQIGGTGLCKDCSAPSLFKREWKTHSSS